VSSTQEAIARERSTDHKPEETFPPPVSNIRTMDIQGQGARFIEARDYYDMRQGTKELHYVFRCVLMSIHIHRNNTTPPL
jgi:hypothetical protein